MDAEMERKFLHDIASPLSVGMLIIKMALKEIEESPAGGAEFLEKLQKRLTKVNAALLQMEELHANHKSHISGMKKAG